MACSFDDILPLLDVPQDCYGLEAAYVTELVHDLDAAQALSAYR